MILDKPDKLTLLEAPAFRRFLFVLIQQAGIFEQTDRDGDGRYLFREGRRSLGLEVLRMFDEAQPIANPDGIPLLTLIQTLRDAAQTAPKEKTVGRRDGTYGELGDDGE